jgi:hypothetical protein
VGGHSQYQVAFLIGRMARVRHKRSESGSPKTVDASSKLTPCFWKLASAFSGFRISHRSAPGLDNLIVQDRELSRRAISSHGKRRLEYVKKFDFRLLSTM